MAGLEQDLGALGIGGAQVIGKALSSKAEDFVNDASIEQIWAIKAMKYAETHFKLLQGCDAQTLRLTRYDDDIYDHFQRTFKGLKLDILNPDDIKSNEAKELWRQFCNHYEGLVNDFNFGSLLRLDVSKDYSEENTILVPRIQFLAIEIARNKGGLNSVHFKNNTN